MKYEIIIVLLAVILFSVGVLLVYVLVNKTVAVCNNTEYKPKAQENAQKHQKKPKYTFYDVINKRVRYEDGSEGVIVGGKASDGTWLLTLWDSGATSGFGDVKNIVAIVEQNEICSPNRAIAGKRSEEQIPLGASSVYMGDEIDDEALCNAIFQAEGGWQATYLYGIKSVPYDSPEEARRICLNTIRNQRERHLRHDCGKSYIICLRDRYCLPEDNLEDNWLKNVRYYYEKETKAKLH